MCQYPDNFGSRRHCASRDTIFLIYHVILQDHVIKGSSDFMAMSHLTELITLPSLVAIDIVAVAI